jgi:flagellar basal-body rod protein FlgB
MSQWLERIFANGVTRGLELSARFTEARHRVLAENVANIDTPDYATKLLDPEAFQASLLEAMERARAAGSRGNSSAGMLELRDNAQFATRPDGSVEVTPGVEPAENILFHDGTNAQLERLMSGVAENALHHQFVTAQLHGRFETLLKAIRGRI